MSSAVLWLYAAAALVLSAAYSYPGSNAQFLATDKARLAALRLQQATRRQELAIRLAIGQRLMELKQDVLTDASPQLLTRATSELDGLEALSANMTSQELPPESGK